jgi:uncharacterized membrane protein (DUF441 family)
MMKQGDLQRILADSRRMEAARQVRAAKGKPMAQKKATARQALKSKTIWVNLILGALVPFLVSLGVEIKPEQASTGLVLVNLILRAVTGEKLSDK